MKKQTMITLALALTLAMPTLPAFAQKAMSKKEIAEKEKAFKNLQHPWKGKKVAYFGDSITDPNIKASKVKYWGFLQDWLGITPYVYGVSGRQWNDIPRQADQLQKEHGDDFDAILIFMGTNDYNNGVPVGEWYTETFDCVRVARHKPSEMVQRRHRHFCMDKNTLKGRINIAMSKLKQMYPTKQIVVMTPVHRALFASGDKNIQPDEMYENARGIFFDEYVKAIKETGNVWAVPVIDLNSLSGLF
jgi:lysophospholipase L1-like esterase